MRIAILAASSYSDSDQVSELSTSELDLDLLGQRLGEADAGFEVRVFRAERGLAEAVEQVLAEATEPIDELFFYFLGYAVVTDERGPALLLAGERLGTFSLKRLKRVLGERARCGLAVLDTVIALDPSADPAAGVETLGAALVDPGASVHLVASCRPETSLAGRAPFTSLVELVLDWHSVKSTELSADGLYGAMRAEEGLFAELSPTGHFAGAEPFVVLRGQSGVPSVPPPAEGPIEPEPAWQEPPKPTGEDRERALGEARAALERGEHEGAAVSYREALRSSPRDADTLRGLLKAFEKANDPEGEYQTAAALEVLGAADVDESLLASAHRPDGLLAAQGVLSEEDWKKKLLCKERDDELDAAFAALGNAVVAAGVETARRKRRGPALDPSTEQDLEKSTTTLARTLAWSARLLGFVRPRFHVLDSVAGSGLALAPVEDPTLTASKVLGSGLGLPELVFLWSRTLVLLRPEHRAVALFTAEELASLLRAASTLDTPGGQRGLDGDTKLLARSLKRHLRGPALTEACEAARRVVTPGLPERLASFQRAVARAGSRAGLLATGNLELSARLIERFADLAAGEVTEQVGDLVLFAVSTEHAALRARIGVAVAKS